MVINKFSLFLFQFFHLLLHWYGIVFSFFFICSFINEWNNFCRFFYESFEPFYIHPNENPTLILVTPLIDSKNYISWFCFMKIAFISKNKLKFIDNTFIKLVVASLLHDPWVCCNNFVLSPSQNRREYQIYIKKSKNIII